MKYIKYLSVAVMLLIAGGAATAKAQSVTLVAEVINSEGHVQLTATRDGYTIADTISVVIARCERVNDAACDISGGQQLAAYTDGNNEPSILGETNAAGTITNFIDTTTEISKPYTYRWATQFSVGGRTFSRFSLVDITATPLNTTTIDEAILPKTLTNITGGINRSIQQRIEQRMKEKR